MHRPTSFLGNENVGQQIGTKMYSCLVVKLMKQTLFYPIPLVKARLTSTFFGTFQPRRMGDGLGYVKIVNVWIGIPTSDSGKIHSVGIG